MKVGNILFPEVRGKALRKLEFAIAGEIVMNVPKLNHVSSPRIKFGSFLFTKIRDFLTVSISVNLGYLIAFCVCIFVTSLMPGH